MSRWIQMPKYWYGRAIRMWSGQGIKILNSMGIFLKQFTNSLKKNIIILKKDFTQTSAKQIVYHVSPDITATIQQHQRKIC